MSNEVACYDVANGRVDLVNRRPGLKTRERRDVEKRERRDVISVGEEKRLKKTIRRDQRHTYRVLKGNTDLIFFQESIIILLRKTYWRLELPSHCGYIQHPQG